MKKEYEQKLKKARAYSKFMKNLELDSKTCGISTRELILNLNEYEFHNFVMGSFRFFETPEGSDYWWKISQL